MPLKHFRATVANADIGSLKSLYTFLKKCLFHMLVKFEQNRLVQTTRNFELFDKNKNKNKKTNKQTNKNKKQKQKTKQNNNNNNNKMGF